MSWLQKISSIDRLGNFFLINGELIFGNSIGYHESYLKTKYGLPDFFANLFRLLFPRGAATRDHDNTVVVEMSPELSQYKSQIAEKLNITAMDRPKWVLTETHYQVNPQHVINVIKEYKIHEQLDSATVRFIQMFIPSAE